MARTRTTDDNPLVAIFMLLLLVGVGVASIRHAVLEKPEANGKYAAAATSEVQSEPRRGPSGSQPRFVEAFKRLPNEATALQQAADEGFDDAARLLGADELTQVKAIMSRNPRSRDDVSDGELDTLRRLGFGKWVRAHAIRWSQEDPAFKTVSTAIWDLSPQSRSDGELTELAAKWGEKNQSSRQELLELIMAVEGKGRDLSAGERAKVVAFAGEEYVANHP